MKQLKTIWHVFICLILGSGLFWGPSSCAPKYQNFGPQNQQSISRPQSGQVLPREVYVSPDVNIYSGARVVIQSFQSPLYAANTGDYAAKSLSRHLLLQNAFQSVRVELENDSLSTFTWEELLGAEDCDILITGQVLFFLEGSTQQQSKVAIEMKAYELVDNSLHLLWHIGTEEVGQPRSAKDFYMFRLPPRPAPSGKKLIDSCMQQCAQALISIPSRPQHDS